MMGLYIREALSALGQYRRLWYGLFGLKLGLARVITLPALILIQSEVDYSLMAKELLGSWSIDVIVELVLAKTNVLSAGVIFLAAFSMLVFLIRQFLNGGIYGTIWSRKPLQRERFFGLSAVHFADHLLISLGMLVVYGVLLLIGVALASFTGFLARSLDAGIPLFGSLVRLATIYLVVVLGVVYSDTVRLRKSARPEEPLPKSFKEAFNFYRRHFVQLVGIYLVFYVPFLLFWLAIEGLALVVTGGLENMAGVVLEMLLFQLCAFLRTAQGLLGIAGISAIIREETKIQVIPTHHEAPVD